jgi:heme-degrading monooxygenase HmoA
MFVVVWAFRPNPAREADFVREYGPDGAWVNLFRSDPRYLGSELFRPADGSGRYLTLDRWQSRAAFEAFRTARRDEYEALDRACEALTASEERVGEYETQE